MSNANEIKMQLEKWKGYSAYELAVLNGYNGTEKEWLESIGASTNITVNRQGVQDDGNIELLASQILLIKDGTVTIKDELEKKIDADDLVNDLTTGGANKMLSAEQGKVLNTSITNLQNGKIGKKTATASLTVAGWSNSKTQTVNVSGVTASNTVIVTPAPASYVHYTECFVRCTAQASGKLTFTATDKPTAALTVNVLILE